MCGDAPPNPMFGPGFGIKSIAEQILKQKKKREEIERMQRLHGRGSEIPQSVLSGSMSGALGAGPVNKPRLLGT